MEHPHRRYNPLTGEYVLVSPHRMKRPWQGQVEKRVDEIRPKFDPKCYLCPSNERAGGARNPNYDSTYVFKNDFAALLPESVDVDDPHPLLRTQAVTGEARVLCFSPRHDLTLPQMDIATVRSVVDLWASQVAELKSQYKWVQVFQNKGPMMGASNPHPHGQIWALDALPNEPAKEDKTQRAYFAENERPLLLDYAQLESEQGERTVVDNEHWIAVVPFWAVWPFETLLLPRNRHIGHLDQLTDAERDALASIVKRLLTRYDNLFETSFAYSMGWHGTPYDDDDQHWQLHAHFYPPLLRSATVRKFMVGFEMLGEAQRDLTAEKAAERLRELSDVYYLEG